MTTEKTPENVTPASVGSGDLLAEIEREEATVKRMSESGFMLTDTDYCCEVVCREMALRERRKLLSANTEVWDGDPKAPIQQRQRT